jgi:hypothetical protein
VIAEEKIYYCIEDASTGFQSSENYKKTDFIEEKFTAKIDFENLFFSSPDMYMTITECKKSDLNLMHCTTRFGSVITINKNNLKFAMANTLGVGTDGDSLTIGYGSCSVF